MQMLAESAGIRSPNRVVRPSWNRRIPVVMALAAIAFGVLIAWQPVLVVVGIVVAVVVGMSLERPWLVVAYVLATLMPLGYVFREVQFGSGATQFNAVGLMRVLVVLFTVLVLGGLAISRKRKGLAQIRLLKPVIIFAAVLVIAAIYAPDRVLSFRWLVNLLTPLCLYLLVASTLRTTRQILIVLIAFIAASIVPLVVAIPETLSGGYYVGGASVDRVVSLADHPNEFAAYLVALLLTVLSMALCANSIRIRVLLGSILGIGLVELLYTFTRAAWGSLFVGIIVILIMYRSTSKVLPSILLLVISLTIFILTFPGLGELLYVRVFVDTGSPESHIYVASQLWQLFLASPIWGHGLYSTPGLLLESIGLSATPHNDYLGTLVETGIVGFCSYLFLIAVAARNLWSERNSTMSSLNRALNCASMALLVGMLVFSLTDGAFNYMGAYVLGIIGLAEVQSRINLSQTKPFMAKQSVYELARPQA